MVAVSQDTQAFELHLMPKPPDPLGPGVGSHTQPTRSPPHNGVVPPHAMQDPPQWPGVEQELQPLTGSQYIPTAHSASSGTGVLHDPAPPPSSVQFDTTHDIGDWHGGTPAAQ